MEKLGGERLSNMLVLSMKQSVQFFGQVAATKYMIPNAPTGEGYFANLLKLTWRMRRLAFSLYTSETNFSETAGVDTLKEGRIETELSTSEVRGRLITFVPYAARHEWGGYFDISLKQIKYFFYRYKNPGPYDPEMWLALAKKGLRGGKIRTPARSFINPTFADPMTTEGIRNILTVNFNRMAEGLAT